MPQVHILGDFPLQIGEELVQRDPQIVADAADGAICLQTALLPAGKAWGRI